MRDAGIDAYIPHYSVSQSVEKCAPDSPSSVSVDLTSYDTCVSPLRALTDFDSFVDCGDEHFDVQVPPLLNGKSILSALCKAHDQ